MPYSSKNQRRLTGYRREISSSNSSLVQPDYDDDTDEHHYDYNTTHQQPDDVYNHHDDQEDHNNKPMSEDHYQQQQQLNEHSYTNTSPAAHLQEDSDYDALDEDEEDDSGSELSIPDPNIDFDMVYALHTFAATVDGQASVVRGDALTLLDDTNSYWWLIKVLKTAEVGYIPAENIETPYERLARLNSHRNIELTRKDIQDAFPIPPSNKPKKLKRVTLAKDVKFQSQIIYGNVSDEDEDYYGHNGDNDDDNDDDSYFASEFRQWNERMRSDDEEEVEDESEIIQSMHDSDDYRYSLEDPYQQYYNEAYDQHYRQQDGLQSASGAAAEKIEVDEDGHDGKSADVIAAPADHAPALSSQPQYTMQQQQQAYESHNRQRFSIESDSVNNDSRESFDLGKDETIKISLTPSIARGDGDDSTVKHHSEAQAKLKKAARLEKLLSEPDQEASDDSKATNGKNSNKKEKSAIRKLFSRDSNNKEKKKDKKKSKDNKKTVAIVNNGQRSSFLSSSSASLERLSSTTSTLETASLESQSNSIASIDPTLILTHPENDNFEPKRLRIDVGNISGFNGHLYVDVYSDTTAQELIDHLTATTLKHESEDVSLHQDYYLIVKSRSGDELTLVPSDKPLEIYRSLTSHLNTPMPSLKKARRISQLMEGGGVHLGGPSSSLEHGNSDEAAVQFFLYCRTKRMDEGEIQVKVSLLYSTNANDSSIEQKRVDKMVRVPANILAKDAVTLLLEKFHILNGVATSTSTAAATPDVDETIESLRLEKGNEVVPYELSVHHPDGAEFVLRAEQRLLEAFGDRNVPQILYKRNSNPDRRSSITVNITSPEKHEVYFILQPAQDNNEDCEKQTYDTHKEDKNTGQTNLPSAPSRPFRVARQNTPMPRHDSPAAQYTDMYPEQISPSPSLYQPQVIMDDEEAAQKTSTPDEAIIASSPEDDTTLFFDANTTTLTHSSTNTTKDTTLLFDTPTATNTIDTTTSTTTSASPDTPTPSPYPPPSVPMHQYNHHDTDALSAAADATIISYNNTKEAPRSDMDDTFMLCEDFGINDLMVLIRGAARSALNKQSHQGHNSSVIQNEINDIFSDSQTRLDQLEKDLDRLMAEAVKIYS